MEVPARIGARTKGVSNEDRVILLQDPLKDGGEPLLPLPWLRPHVGRLPWT